MKRIIADPLSLSLAAFGGQAELFAANTLIISDLQKRNLNGIPMAQMPSP